MWGFGIDPALPVFQVSPCQVHRQPDSVPPEPLIQHDKHPSTLTEPPGHTNTRRGELHQTCSTVLGLEGEDYYMTNNADFTVDHCSETKRWRIDIQRVVVIFFTLKATRITSIWKFLLILPWSLISQRNLMFFVPKFRAFHSPGLTPEWEAEETFLSPWWAAFTKV